MTDRPAELFVDLSSNNPRLDVAKYLKAGHRTVALKATEGTTYSWNDGLATGREAHAAGLSVIWYHFARPGSGVAQADAFLHHLAGEIQPGDGLCIDCEVAGVKGTLVTAWLNRVAKAHPKAELWIYGGAYFLRDNGIKPSHDAKLWLAAYGSTYPFIPPGWDHYDAWQFTDAATVKGVASKVDLSRLRVGAKPPTPKPVKPTRLSGPQRLATRYMTRVFRRLHAKDGHLAPASRQILLDHEAATTDLLKEK